MSAFICNDYHIAELVDFYVKEDSRNHFNRQGLFDLLRGENYRSVNYRYDESNKPEPFDVNKYIAQVRNPVAILKMVDCLEYQSCEHPDYRESEAWAVLKAIRFAAIDALPGYDDAPWEFHPAESAA